MRPGRPSHPPGMGGGMNDLDLLLRFAAALAVGLLIGLQRQFALGDPRRDLALGVRTFALFSAAGYSSVVLSDLMGSPAAFAAVFSVLGLLVAAGYFKDVSSGKPGLTTRAAAMLTVVLGGLAVHARLTLVAAIGVAAMALLSFKGEMHRFARHVTREDLFAALKFAVVSAVILPVLPDRDIGPFPFDALNPYRIWLFVVLVSGIGFVGYALVKWKGSKKGIVLTGLVGGLASSTAVTVGFARRSKSVPRLGRLLTVAVLLSWTVMFLRVWAILAVINPAVLSETWPSLAAPAVAGFLACAFLWRTLRNDRAGHRVELTNPFELGTSLKYGALFAAVLLVSRLAQSHYGESGVYAFSFLSGLLDVDAVVLSTAQMQHGSAGLNAHAASIAISLAAAANTLFKAAVCWMAGGSGFRNAVFPGFLAMTAACLAGAFLF
jgi:uncharacterized membrane protein (DUF4010 family)